MATLRWVHVTREEAYPYLTPAMWNRPVRGTCTKGVHGPLLSEFALGLILALASGIVYRQKLYQTDVVEKNLLVS